MLINITARYQVRRHAVDKCFQAVIELVEYVKKKRTQDTILSSKSRSFGPNMFFSYSYF